MTAVLEVPVKRWNAAVKKIANPVFSDEDADLREIAWGLLDGCARVSRRVNGKNIAFLAHRVVLSRKLGRPLVAGELTDHRNRNRLDNRRSNLRLATRTQNNQNHGLRVDSTSGHRGVTWHKPTGRWRVRAHLNGKVINGGLFTDLEEAAAKAAELRKSLGFWDDTE